MHPNRYNTTIQAMDDLSPVDKYEQHVDLMNECRAFYYSRIQKTEHYKALFCTESLQLPMEVPQDKQSSLALLMQTLQQEIVSLLDEDLSLMRQLLTLNENIEEMKNRPFHEFSKESFGSSLFHLHSRCQSENEEHLPTVLSQGDMEKMVHNETSIFDEIKNYVDDDHFDSIDDKRCLPLMLKDSELMD